MLNVFIIPWELESEIGFSQESGDLADAFAIQTNAISIHFSSFVRTNRGGGGCFSFGSAPSRVYGQHTFQPDYFCFIYFLLPSQ
jgi:hypothetical protein